MLLFLAFKGSTGHPSSIALTNRKWYVLATTATQTAMGNDNSNPEKHGEWTSPSECSCGEDYLYVKKVRWIKVPMSPDSSRIAWDVGRPVLAVVWPLAFAATRGGVKDLSHECIELLYTCNKDSCRKSGRYTAEILAQDDKRFQHGYYSSELGEVKSYTPSSMTIAYARTKFNEMGESYNLVYNNCSDWSSELWRKL